MSAVTTQPPIDVDTTATVPSGSGDPLSELPNDLDVFLGKSDNAPDEGGDSQQSPVDTNEPDDLPDAQDLTS